MNNTEIKLTPKNFMLFAAKNYQNPKCIDEDEFQEDLKRFKYIKRLLNRYYAGGDLSERLILNHLIVLLNVFGNEPTIEMLAMKIQLEHWPTLKPFLIYLRALKNDEFTGIKMDKIAINALREIARL
ncbi:MAG: hypothetical protein CMA07_06735 [Euryarchaeota archaeon]|nr:hypothetical protein [Euryarchaeota archaeon]|tara:strand:- start:3093 stop:3473 length:381 start_codon:yes stop_codon:yes gene_type:complete